MTADRADRDFVFDLNSPRKRITDEAILASLRRLVVERGGNPPTTLHFDHWPHRACTAGTVSKRFGSWRKALDRIGLAAGARERQYDSLELMDNLESVWRELGYAPGRRQLAKHGAHISERPYQRVWGSVRNACNLLSQFKRGDISEGELFREQATNPRKTISLQVRWNVQKRDHYTCRHCGRRPPECVLEVDHIVPHALGGTDVEANLQTLCRDCNQGKKAQRE